MGCERKENVKNKNGIHPNETFSGLFRFLKVN